MSDQPGPSNARTIDQVSGGFEADLKAGRRPSIEQYVAAVPEARRADLLRELLSLELEDRLRRGDRPLLHEYQQRFPANPELVMAAFAKPVPALPDSATRPEPSKPGMILTATEGPHTGETFTLLGHDIFLVGRSKQTHLQIKDGYFSRFHFMVEVNPPHYRLSDLGSRNRTYVNGLPAQTSDLHDGDLIKAGHTSLRVSIPSPPRERAALTGAETAAEYAQTLTEPAPNVLLAATLAPPVPAPSQHPKSAEIDLPQIAGYELIRELGRGGMGVVYLAIRQADRSQVAVKTIKPAVASSRGEVERFVREANILCQLQHRHIVGFRDVGESGGRLYFAMDFVDGINAEILVKQRGGLPVRNAVRIVSQLLVALEYAHGKGFVHRDIKPANLLITQEAGKKVVKLADFGLARVYQESRLSGLTMQGETGGTMAFMPPEQITQFRHVKPPADQYAAAATLYNLLTASYLFDFKPGKTSPLALILQDNPVPILVRRPDLPESLASVIHRALAKTPEDRFRTIHGFREALQPFLD